MADLRLKFGLLTVTPRAIIPLNERNLPHVFAEWAAHDNAERPHPALGPGLPDNPATAAVLTKHELAPGWRVAAEKRLGGLHHHYGLEWVT